MTDLSGITVPTPDGAAAEAVRVRLGAADGAISPYGRLAEWAALLAAADAGVPSRVVLLGVAGQSPAPGARAGVAERSGAVLRELDAGIDVEAAFAAGRAAVDVEVDAGADLLLIAAPARAHGAAARALVSALTGTEPVHLVGWPAAGADEDWMSDLVAVRDLRRRVAGHSAEPDELLGALDDPPLALLAGALVQAAVRRTLAVIDGVAAGGAALAAHRLVPAALAWWVGADRSLDPTAVLVAAQLGLLTVLDLDLRVDDGTAGLLAAELLASAGRVAAQAAAG